MKIARSVLLFNPRSANSKARIPNSILAVAAALEGQFEWEIIDGNAEVDPWPIIEDCLSSGKFAVFGCTVMPGIQPRQAIPISKKIKEQFPEITIVWGGYFPASHPLPVLKSGFVDYIIKGPVGYTMTELVSALINKSEIPNSPNLMYLKDGLLIHSEETKSLDSSNLFIPLPYEKFHQRYPARLYLKETWLGKRTFQYHSSFGCPYDCSFCAIPDVFHKKWMGMDGDLLGKIILNLKSSYQLDAIEFSDNNFFVNEDRVVSFCEKIVGHNIQWWAEGRVDTLLNYKESSLQLMRRSGCRMIFMGAESGNNQTLANIGKGGNQSPQDILNVAQKLKQFDIIPEFSFVLGFPEPDHKSLYKSINTEIRFIKKLKHINSKSEIILYVYSPLPDSILTTDPSETSDTIVFPDTLESWLQKEWRDFDLRRNPATPWMTKRAIRKIRNFEIVLIGHYPSISNINMTPIKRSILSVFSMFRYRTNIFCAPIEIRILLHLFHYYRPEKEGF